MQIDLFKVKHAVNLDVVLFFPQDPAVLREAIEKELSRETGKSEFNKYYYCNST